MEELIQFDKHLLLMLNGSDSVFLDYVVMTLTNAKTWIPLYLALFYVVIKSNMTKKDILFVVAAAGLCVLCAGGFDDSIVKPLVARWRPTHDPQIGMVLFCSCQQHLLDSLVLFFTDASSVACRHPRLLFPG